MTVIGFSVCSIVSASTPHWFGKVGAGGWYIAMAYNPTVTMNNLVVDLEPDSLTNIQYLYSLDSKDWSAWTPSMANTQVQLNYLWLIFPADGTDAVPKVREIRLQQ